MRSSMASIHSLADSMGDEEFLPASPFNPKNLALRRAQREEVGANKVGFQAEFYRVDSMAYCGRGIVEDNDNVAPISLTVARGQQAQPPPRNTGAQSTSSSNSNKNMHNCVDKAGRPPSASRVIMSDNNKVASAMRHRVGGGRIHHNSNNRCYYGSGSVATAEPSPEPFDTSLHIPAPPPSPSHSNVNSRTPQSETGSRDGPSTAAGTKATTTTTDTVRSTVTTAAFSSSTTHKLNSPRDKRIMDPSSATDYSIDTNDLAAVTLLSAERTLYPSLPPRATAPPCTNHGSSNIASSKGQQRSVTDRFKLGIDHVSGNNHSEVRHPAFHADRLRKVDTVDFIAPLSPAKASPIANDGSLPSPGLRSIATSNSSMSQSSVLTLPPPSTHCSTNGKGAPHVVQRRNSSPARVRRASTAVITTTPTGVTSINSSLPPVAATVLASSNGSTNVLSPLVFGACVKKDDSSNVRTKNKLSPQSPSSVGRSSDVGSTPVTNQCLKLQSLTEVKGAPASLQATGSSASRNSTAASVTSAASRNSLVAFSASSLSSTPVATPSATLCLLAEKTTPSLRLAAAARLTITPTSTRDKVTFHPPLPPQRKTLGPTPVPVLASQALDSMQFLNNNNTCCGRSPSRDGGNEDLLRKAKNTPCRWSLLDAGGTDLSDSVRRQYYCLPSNGEKPIPNFAMHAGDLHVKSDNPLSACGSATTNKNANDNNKESANGWNDDSEYEVNNVTAVLFPAATTSSSPPTVHSLVKKLNDCTTLSSASSPVTKPPRDPTSRLDTPNSSSAVPHVYLSDASPTVTGVSLKLRERSPLPDRLISHKQLDAPSETDGSERTMEPLMLDAVRTFNNRIRQTHMKR